MTANVAAADLERELGKAIVKAVGRKDARRLLAAPSVLQSAVATASAAWEVFGAIGSSRLPAGDGARARLTPFVLEGEWATLWPDDELLTTDEAAELTGKYQPTILEWIKKGRLVGLTRKKRGYRVPKEQFGKKGEIIEGIDDVVAILPDHNTAWSFLTEPYPFDKGLARPIDVLKKGAREEVAAAARSWGTDFS